MKTILVAIDGSNHSNRAIQLASDIASKYDAKLLLLHVVDAHTLTEEERQLATTEFSELLGRHALDSDMEEIRTIGAEGAQPFFSHHAETGMIIHTALGEGFLEAASREAKACGAENVETILENGDPAKTILDVANKHHANLIVIGSRGQSDVKALFMGSVSHKVSNLSDINVITVK